MAELGALGQYALNVQNMQVALVKNQVQLQQKAIEVLMEAAHDVSVAASETLGTNLDISV